MFRAGSRRKAVESSSVVSQRATIWFYVLVGLGCNLVGLAQRPAQGPISPVRQTPEAMGYELVWADDFNGNALDPQKWAVRGVGPRALGYVSPEAVTVGDGYLKLHALKKDDRILLGAVGTQDRFMTRGLRDGVQEEAGTFGRPAGGCSCPNDTAGDLRRIGRWRQADRGSARPHQRAWRGPTSDKSIGRKPSLKAGDSGRSRKSCFSGSTKSGSAITEWTSRPLAFHSSNV